MTHTEALSNQIGAIEKHDLAITTVQALGREAGLTDNNAFDRHDEE